MVNCKYCRTNEGKHSGQVPHHCGHYFWCNSFQLGSKSQIETRWAGADPRFFGGRGRSKIFLGGRGGPGLQNQWGVLPKCCNLRIGILYGLLLAT